MTEARTIGIDVGTTNLKVVALDREGEVVARGISRYQVQPQANGWVVQNPQDWLGALEDCIAVIRKECSVRNVDALGISAQGETLVCCDDQGRPLDPAISWMDNRAVAEAEELVRLRDDWRERTGKTVAASSSLAKIRWLRKHRPELAGQTARFCQVGDFLVAHLCGEWLLDTNNASFTCCFDLRERRWDADLVRQFDLQGKLPLVRESGTIAGALLEKHAQRWGIGAATRVVLGGHDQACAAVGAFPVSAGRKEDGGEEAVLLSTGTAWVLYASMPEPRLEPHGRLVTYCHARPGQWAALAAFSGGGALNAFSALFGKADYAHIESCAVETGNLIFLPYFFGANAPAKDPLARAAILGLGPEHGPEHVFHALLESIAFETRRNLEIFVAMGIKPSRLIMVGGATKSKIWPQIVANACRIPVHISAEPDSAALGAGILAGEAVGRFAAQPRLPRVIEVQPGVHDRLAAKYTRYLDAVAMDRARRRAAGGQERQAEELKQRANTDTRQHHREERLLENIHASAPR